MGIQTLAVGASVDNFLRKDFRYISNEVGLVNLFIRGF